MPEANEQLWYGKFRRLILNFVFKTENEIEYKKLLPESSLSFHWWKQAMIGRDVGRDLLRIHGTSLINKNPDSNYFPFIPTSGCLAQREGIYGEQEYVDQRRLLDQLMISLDLSPVFDNETKIKGLLYILEIDDQKAPVTISELQSLLLD
jgi:hypothetical protein